MVSMLKRLESRLDSMEDKVRASSEQHLAVAAGAEPKKRWISLLFCCFLFSTLDFELGGFV